MMPRIKAFAIEGVDLESGTVLVEIDRSILAPMANMLETADYTKGTGLAVRALGHNLRNACSCLYGEAELSQFDFPELDPEEEEDEQSVSTGTGG